MPEASQAAPLRIQYINTLNGTLDAALAKAGRLGFSHVLLAPPWVPSPRGDRFAPASLSALDPALSVTTLAALTEAASRHGLKLLLDVQLNRLAPGTGGTLGAGLFYGTDSRVVLDPRHTRDVNADTALPVDAQQAAALGAFWAGYLANWCGDGVAGFRLLGLSAIPAHWLGDFLSALRQGAPAAPLFAWTPGLSAEAMQALRGQGLAGVFPSLPWWDFHAPWFWRELEVLRGVAPVIGAPEAPGGPSVYDSASGPTDAPAWYRRAARMAASLGSGWLALEGGSSVAGSDMAPFILELNQTVEQIGPLNGAVQFPAGTGGRVLALLRTDTPDRRFATQATITVVNTDAAMRQSIDTSLLLTALGGRGAGLRRITVSGGDEALAPGLLSLAPAEAQIFMAVLPPSTVPPTRVSEAAALEAAAGPRLAIEAIAPAVDGGLFPVKRIAGETVAVSADVVFDGHEKIAVALRHRARGSVEAGSAEGGNWAELRMRPLGNDRWQAEFPLTCLGRHEFVVTAWRDAFETYRDEIAKKHAAGVDITLELTEGVVLVRATAEQSGGELRAQLAVLADRLSQATDETRRETLLSTSVAALMAQADPRPFAVASAAMPVDAERLEARFASWYEVFPRSLSDDENRHGTFDDVIRHMPRIRDMGFDVLYFPPVHPIGRTNRKGRNNSLTPAPSDPGSPYAIGGEAGGHDALHPQLGTLDDFRRMREAAATHGLELAIDFAIQCAPDHPWLREHAGWFDWRPDGTIKYAENPPKKYEDIVNVDFYAPDAIPGLWIELCRVVLFWAGQGVRLFRVDNPHTKPFPFWEWMIREVRQRYPDAIFLAEAFTRPKIMYRLAKIGFSQSYTYFTWRNTKRELQAYSTELADEAPREFFRPHFFVNTPDINPLFLQTSGRPGFLIRAALAATLSGLWGVYNGFELCEAAALPGREEYRDSEKYQLRAWDWQRPGNIVAEITALNRIRRENPALQTHLGVEFHNAFNDSILYFEKATADRANVVLVAISLDPSQPQEADIEIPLWNWGLRDDGSVNVEDLVGGGSWVWHGKLQRVRLTPDKPYAIWRVVPTGMGAGL
jgi:starch synthase (maltosyl-transferring)